MDQLNLHDTTELQPANPSQVPRPAPPSSHREAPALRPAYKYSIDEKNDMLRAGTYSEVTLLVLLVVIC